MKRIADHVGSTCDKAGDIRQVIKELKVTTQTEPILVNNPSKMEEKIWDTNYKQYLQQETLI